MQTASLPVDPSRLEQPPASAEAGYEVRISSRFLPTGLKDGLFAFIAFYGWIFLWLAGLAAGMAATLELSTLPEEYTDLGELARFVRDSVEELWALALLLFLAYWIVRVARGITLLEIGHDGLKLMRRMGKPVVIAWGEVRELSRGAFHPGTGTVLGVYRISGDHGTFHFAPADVGEFESAISRLRPSTSQPVETVPTRILGNMWLLVRLGLIVICFLPPVLLLTSAVKFMAEWANTGTAYLNRPLMRAFLLKPSAKAPHIQQDLLVHGVKAGDTYVVRKTLARLGSIRETEFKTPILEAAIQGRYPPPQDAREQKAIPAGKPGDEDRRASVIRLLVAHGAHIEPGALLTAALGQRPRLFATLVELGAPLDDVSQGVPDISRAAEKSTTAALALYLNAGADPNQADNDGRTPLAHAASAGREDSVRLLLKHGAKFDARDFEGGTVAHAAALGGNVKLLESVVERAGGYQARRNDGETLMHAAARGEKLPMMQHLLQHGLSAGVTDKDGGTPLHLARGSATVDFLLQNGADINARAADGTPLHVAVRLGAWDNVRKLLASGARKDIADRQGKIPRDYLPRTEEKRGAKQRAVLQEISTLLTP